MLSYMYFLRLCATLQTRTVCRRYGPRSLCHLACRRCNLQFTSYPDTTLSHHLTSTTSCGDRQATHTATPTNYGCSNSLWNRWLSSALS